MPKYLENEICEKTGLIKKKRKNKNLEDEFNNPHWNIHSYVQETKHNHKRILMDYLAYQNNLKKFHEIVPSHMRTRPIYKFLCFLLNNRHKNTVVLSHFGSRFDVILVCEMILGRPKAGQDLRLR